MKNLKPDIQVWKTDDHVWKCPQWYVEWRKERAENELKGKAAK